MVARQGRGELAVEEQREEKTVAQFLPPVPPVPVSSHGYIPQQAEAETSSNVCPKSSLTDMKYLAVILLLLWLWYFWPSNEESFGSDSGALFPDSGVDDATVGTVAWTNPDRVVANDDSSAVASLTGSVGEDSHYINITDFDFAIPAGATINGIEVNAGILDGIAGIADDNSVKIVKGGTITGDEKASGTDY